MRAATRAPRRAIASTVEAFRGLLALGNELRPSPPLSIQGAIGPHRRWAAARSTLADIKAVRRALGGTVNDVVLSAITGAFRHLLLARGDSLDRAVLRSLVPVSVRAADDRTANNQVTAMIAELPVGVADPLERLEAVRRQMAELKASHQAVAGEAITSLAGFAAPTLLALGLRTGTATARRFPQRSVNTVTTNVPGPQHPLYAAGREMVEYLPFVPLGPGRAHRRGHPVVQRPGELRRHRRLRRRPRGRGLLPPDRERARRAPGARSAEREAEGCGSQAPAPATRRAAAS